MRQLNEPVTLPSSCTVALNPNCEKAVTPSTVPRPPPATELASLARTGAAATVIRSATAASAGSYPLRSAFITRSG
jgi:hypothetical protein